MISTKVLLRFILQSLAQTVPSVPEQYAGTLIKGVGMRPAQNRGALIKLYMVAVSSLYFGGFIAHKAASYLEENEIFIPSEDDDDD